MVRNMNFKFVSPSIYINFDIQTKFEVNQTQIGHSIPKRTPKTHQSGGGGGGANTKVPDMYGVGGVFGTQNTKVTCTLLYNKGGVSIFYPESQKYKWYFCTHIS